MRSAYLSEALNLLDTDDGHDTGDNGNLNPDSSASFDKTEVVGIVEKELGHQKLGARINLPLEIFQIKFRRGALGVFLGIGCASDTQIVAATNESHQFVRMRKAIRMRHKLCVTFRRIASKCQYVLHPIRHQFLQHVLQLGLAGTHAGQVRHAFNAKFVLDPPDKVQGLASSAATRTVGDGDEGGLEQPQQTHGPEELFEAGFVFGWEKLEGETGPVAL